MTEKEWVFCIGFCILWFILWGMWFHYKLQKWVYRRCKVPGDYVGDNRAEYDAKRVQKFYIERAKQVCKDADDSIACIMRGTQWRLFQDWEAGFKYLQAWMWLSYRLGIGIKFHTYNTKECPREKDKLTPELEKWVNRYPSEFDHLKFFKKPMYGVPVSSILAIILSGGALLSIIAFFILRVQDN